MTCDGDLLGSDARWYRRQKNVSGTRGGPDDDGRRFGRAPKADDYVDSDGLVRWGEIRPATRKTWRAWLAEHCSDGDAEFALEGCTGWPYVVEELRAAGIGAHLGDPAETAALRGPKKRAKTDRADARLLRTLLLEGRFPESWIPPEHVVEIRTLGRLYCTLMEDRRGWQQRIHAQLFHQGCPPVSALLSVAGREALAGAELSPAGRHASWPPARTMARTRHWQWSASCCGAAITRCVSSATPR